MPSTAVTPQQYEFFATCPRNTESLLADEIRAQGISAVAETRGGVAFTGPLEAGLRVCLWSRVASRVFLSLAHLVIRDTEDLYEGVFALEWAEHLAPEGTLAVTVTSAVERGPLARLNTHFAEQRVKDAVVDRLRTPGGRRPTVDIVRPAVRIGVHLRPLVDLEQRRAAQATRLPEVPRTDSGQVEAIVSLDLSGESLHKRGYRVAGGEAPLKENLAAAVLLRAGWPAVAASGGPLLDPMCGSGTFLLEGALMAADVAPGLFRDYWGFLGWRGLDGVSWHTLLREAEERRETGLGRLPALVGYDADERALAAARANAAQAGLSQYVTLQRRRLEDLRGLGELQGPTNSLPRGADTAGAAASRADTSGAAAARAEPAAAPHGLVVTNPPYGKRLGGLVELVPLYETLGRRLKEHFAGWEAAILTANPDLSAHLGLRAHRRNTFYNGPLEARLLLCHIGPRPTAQVTSDPGAVMFANRLQKNFRHLSRWARREAVSCYRLYDADLPEYAVAIDLYGDWAHVQEYAPPPEIDAVKARRRLSQVVETVPQVLGIPREHVVVKVRSRQRGTRQYQRLETRNRFLEVSEGGLRFLVNLTDYLDTGLFLDHRPIRYLLRELAAGRRFLNLFAYTGAATVYAAAGGAVSTTSVDLSPTYLEWARRNLEQNGFTPPRHTLIRADVLAWLGVDLRAEAEPDSPRLSAPHAPPLQASYDLIFLDPPTFSNSKSMRGTLDIQRDHAKLIRAVMRLLAPGGLLIFSTNFRRFRLDPAVAEEFSVRDITARTIPPDFARNRRIHSCFEITASSRSLPGSQSLSGRFSTRRQKRHGR